MNSISFLKICIDVLQLDSRHHIKLIHCKDPKSELVTDIPQIRIFEVSTKVMMFEQQFY